MYKKMKVEYDYCFESKDDFTVALLPTIGFGKDSGKWWIGFVWLVFSVQISKG